MSDVLVICYHGVSARWPSSLAITPEQLEQQLRFLVRRGYRGATFEQAVLSPSAARTLAVTFDDGYRSVLTQALPVLDSLGLPGTVFVVTDFVGQDRAMSWPGIEEWVGTPHEDELVSLSWEELRLLRDAGWEVGSHTRSHPRLSRLHDSTLRRELHESRIASEERLGGCTTLALPYGDGDDRVLAGAEAAGYAAVGGLPAPGVPTAGWPRVGVYPPDSLPRFRVKVARPVRRVREGRLLRPLEALLRGRPQTAGHERAELE